LRLTEGETKALLASALLVVLAAFGRLLLTPDVAELSGSGLAVAQGVDMALAVAESTRNEAERRKQPLAAGEAVDLNKATEVELDRLPGVGPALARAIVESRQQEGPFRSLRDLRRVPGLGQKKVSQLEPYTTLPESVVGVTAGTDGDAGRLPAPAKARPARVNLNRASAEELETLPGIGPARARAIGDVARYRSRAGPSHNTLARGAWSLQESTLARGAWSLQESGGCSGSAGGGPGDAGTASAAGARGTLTPPVTSSSFTTCCTTPPAGGSSSTPFIPGRNGYYPVQS
jgi:competence ComEA-like helix-hairpin-helix protein